MFTTIIRRLREYNRITATAHHLRFYADASGCVFKEGCPTSLYTFDNLEMLDTWLKKEIEEIYWPNPYDVGMVLENSEGIKFTVEFVNKTHAILSNDCGFMWRVKHGCRKSVCPSPSISTIELTKLLRV